MHRLKILLIGLALAMMLGASVVLAGCGSASEDSTTTTEAPVATYTDSYYGFSFDYPSDWRVNSSGVIQNSVGAAATAEVIAVDPEGATVDNVGLDLVTVRTYELGTAVDESDLPDVLAYLQSSVTELQAMDPTVQVEEPLADTVVGGIKGFQVTYTFDWPDGTRLQSTSYYLFAGELEYELIVQATVEDWEANQDVFADFIASFATGDAAE